MRRGGGRGKWVTSKAASHRCIYLNPNRPYQQPNNLCVPTLRCDMQRCPMPLLHRAVFYVNVFTFTVYIHPFGPQKHLHNRSVAFLSLPRVTSAARPEWPLITPCEIMPLTCVAQLNDK